MSPVLLEPGAPKIADLDGDGTAEVMVTGHSHDAHRCSAGRIVRAAEGARNPRVLRTIARTLHRWGYRTA